MKKTHHLNIFFCVGSQKSGTTLLARVLDQHPEIACICESYGFRPNSSASIFNPASTKWRRHGFSEADIQQWSQVWNAQPRARLRTALNRFNENNILTKSCFRETMSMVFADFAHRCGASVVGDKWPGYIRYLNSILSVFEEARIIYTIRDPRGLWNSAQRFKGRQRGDDLLQMMLQNDDMIRPFLKRQNFLTIRYEDLVCDSKKTIQRLYNFLDCDNISGNLRYDPELDPYPDRWYWVPEATESVDSKHASKWKEMLSLDESNYIHNVAFDFMKCYGYEF